MGFDFDLDSDFEFAFDLCKLIRWRIQLAAFAFYVILDAPLGSARLEGGWMPKTLDKQQTATAAATAQRLWRLRNL